MLVCMQLSLANCTYLLRESSLIDLFNKIMGRVLLSSIPNKIHNKIERTKLSNTKSPTRSLSKTNTSHEKSKCLISLVLVFTRIGCKVQDCCSLWLEWGYQLPAGVEFFKTIKHLVDWKVHKYMYTCVYICKRERGLCDDMSGSKRGWEVQNNMKWAEVIAAHAVPEEPYMIRAITLSLYKR